MVSIHRPLGYEPNALPLRHFATVAIKNIPGGIRTLGLLLRKQTPYHWATGTRALRTRSPKLITLIGINGRLDYDHSLPVSYIKD